MRSSINNRVMAAAAWILVLVLPLICSGAETDISDLPVTLKDQVSEEMKDAIRSVSVHADETAKGLLLEIIGKDGPEKGMASFLLGRICVREGSFEDAEKYLVLASDEYPLLRDYSLDLLAGMYISTEKYEKAVETSRRIRNRLLKQQAQQAEITALLAMKHDKEAQEALMRYADAYPSDWERKLLLGMALKTAGNTEQAVRILKEIYIEAVPESDSAFKELKDLNAAALTHSEALMRANNLFEKNNFQRAESEYRSALVTAGDEEKDRIRFSIGMCQFSSKQYGKAALTFGMLKTPDALYYKGWSLYRLDDRPGFLKVKKEFSRSYPDDERYAQLLIMEGEELRRQKKYKEAEESFREVIKRFPGKSEEALWGMGWMSYVSGNFREAAEFFSRLATFEKSDNYYKYLYWSARSREKAAEKCRARGLRDASDEADCGPSDGMFDGIPADRSFYGYLISMRSSEHAFAERIELQMPSRPEGEEYERVEALALLGMNDEASREITDLLKRSRNNFFYLSNIAMAIGEYRGVISFAEKEPDPVFFPYSFPFGFGDIIEDAAEPFHVDKFLVSAVIREESRFDPQAVSWAGARGLMQLMPATAYRLKKELKLDMTDRDEIHDVAKNITLGTYYLSKLIEEFGDVPLAVAAYNAGENALRRWMDQYGTDDLVEFIENIPYKETRFYVKKVLRSYWRYRTINGLPLEGYQIVAREGQGAGNRGSLP